MMLENLIFLEAKTMVNKKFWLGMLTMSFILCGSLISCFSTGKARETIPRTAITLQRPRESTTLLGEIFGADASTDTVVNTPLKIFLNDEVYELANGESKTVTVTNGSYMVYAVLGNIESKSVKFTANSKTIAVNVSLKRSLVLGRINLEIEVKQ